MVLTVSVAVFAAVPLIVTAVGRLHVAGSLAACGVMAQLRLTEPVKPYHGVAVIVEVFAVAAPAVTVTDVPLIEK